MHSQLAAHEPSLGDLSKPGIQVCGCTGERKLQVLDFVAGRIRADIDDIEPASALGVYLEGRLIAGVIYNNYHKLKHGSFMELSAAADDRRWLTRKVLAAIFFYPFGQIKVTRLQALVRRDNKVSRKLVEGLGFKYEGMMRKLYDGRYDAVVYSMIPKEYTKFCARFKISEAV